MWQCLDCSTIFKFRCLKPSILICAYFMKQFIPPLGCQPPPSRERKYKLVYIWALGNSGHTSTLKRTSGVVAITFVQWSVMKECHSYVLSTIFNGDLHYFTSIISRQRTIVNKKTHEMDNAMKLNKNQPPWMSARQNKTHVVVIFFSTMIPKSKRNKLLLLHLPNV